MIVDSSAIVAIVCREPGHEDLRRKLAAASVVAVPAPILFEAAMVLTIKLRRDGLALVNDFVAEAEMEVMPFSRQHASAAYSAFMRFGKGRHRAALNFGDCFSYAAAQMSGEPLLYVGNDFRQTDVTAA